MKNHSPPFHVTLTSDLDRQVPPNKGREVPPPAKRINQEPSLDSTLGVTPPTLGQTCPRLSLSENASRTTKGFLGPTLMIPASAAQGPFDSATPSLFEIGADCPAVIFQVLVFDNRVASDIGCRFAGCGVHLNSFRTLTPVGSQESKTDKLALDSSMQMRTSEIFVARSFKTLDEIYRHHVQLEIGAWPHWCPGKSSRFQDKRASPDMERSPHKGHKTNIRVLNVIPWASRNGGFCCPKDCCCCQSRLELQVFYRALRHRHDDCAHYSTRRIRPLGST